MTAPENAAIRIIVERAVKILQKVIISRKEAEEKERLAIKSEAVPEESNPNVMKTEQGSDELFKENSTQVPVDLPSPQKKEDEIANQPSVETSTTNRDSGNDKNKNSLDVLTYCKLGHLHLLLEEYDEGMNIHILRIVKKALKMTTFLSNFVI